MEDSDNYFLSNTSNYPTEDNNFSFGDSLSRYRSIFAVEFVGKAYNSIYSDITYKLPQQEAEVDQALIWDGKRWIPGDIVLPVKTSFKYIPRKQERDEHIILYDESLGAYTNYTIDEYVNYYTNKYDTWQISKVPGPQGRRGIQGDKGPQGIKGNIGPQGNQGPIGITGDPGIRGDKGDKGPQGIKGNQGPQGDTGDMGSKGAKGDRGADGKDGEKGDKGKTGIRGIDGLDGDQGDIGATGLKGDQGPKGDTGIKGPTGKTGLIGPRGSVGLKGDDGVSFEVAGKDYTGPPGYTGIFGLGGGPGPSGPVGPNGFPGPRGPAGTGSIGAQGSAGGTGPRGTTGKSYTFNGTEPYAIGTAHVTHLKHYPTKNYVRGGFNYKKSDYPDFSPMYQAYDKSKPSNSTETAQVTWKNISNPVSDFISNGIHYNRGVYYIYGTKGTIVSSTDGDNFTPLYTFSDESISLVSMDSHVNRLVVLGYTETRKFLGFSADNGKTWTESFSAIDAAKFTGCAIIRKDTKARYVDVILYGLEKIASFPLAGYKFDTIMKTVSDYYFRYKSWPDNKEQMVSTIDTNGYAASMVLDNMTVRRKSTSYNARYTFCMLSGQYTNEFRGLGGAEIGDNAYYFNNSSLPNKNTESLILKSTKANRMIYTFYNESIITSGTMLVRTWVSPGGIIRTVSGGNMYTLAGTSTGFYITYNYGVDWKSINVPDKASSDFTMMSANDNIYIFGITDNSLTIKGTISSEIPGNTGDYFYVPHLDTLNAPYIILYRASK